MNVVGLSRNLLMLPLLKAPPTMTVASDPAVSDLFITPNGSSRARALNVPLKSSAMVRTQIKSARLKYGCGRMWPDLLPLLLKQTHGPHHTDFGRGGRQAAWNKRRN